MAKLVLTLIHVYEGISFTAKNLITYRGTHSPQGMRESFAMMNEHIKNVGAEIAGHVMSVMYSSDNETRVSDMQIFIPLNKEITPMGGFGFIHELNLSDCLMVRHKGDSQSIPCTYLALLEKADNLGREIKLPIYNVMVAGEVDEDGKEQLDIEVYAECE